LEKKDAPPVSPAYTLNPGHTPFKKGGKGAMRYRLRWTDRHTSIPARGERVLLLGTGWTGFPVNNRIWEQTLNSGRTYRK